MYTLINCSPKLESSNSLKFLDIISKELDNYVFFSINKDSREDIISNIYKSDVIVFALPLYVDAPPSKLLEFFDYIIDNNIKFESKLVYFVINCGFREAEQNVTALNIIKNWCKKVNLKYCSSILIGAGEVVGNKKFRFISKKFLKDIENFATFIKEKKETEEFFTTVDYINNNIYCYFANMFWNRNAKHNKLSISDIKKE
ncbi:MAG: hypothetical protein IJD92_04560 [Bacilli bacterium]|nr:hypothetical protein [Bacilli bacterium]